MNTIPTSSGSSSVGNVPYNHGIPDMLTGNATQNTHSDSSANIGNVSHSYNNTINVGLPASDESLRIQAWLSPLEPHARHNDVRNRRLAGIGEWVLRKDEFESWHNGQDGSMNPTLLCYGIQGVGKTYMSSLVIDTLRVRACGQNRAVLSLYCDYQVQKDQTTVNMIGGLLKQVVAGAKEIPGEIRSAFEGLGQRGGKRLVLPDMLGLFVKTISSFERVYMCFDALDELLPQHRSGFLRALRQITREAPNTRLFLTARPYLRKELDKYLTDGAYIINVMVDQGDIARYISQKIGDDVDREPDLMTEDMKNDITKTLLERSSQMFLLVALNVEAILGETSVAERKEMLQEVATGGVDLDSAYDRVLSRVCDQEGDRAGLGVAVLMLISHAQRPLRIDELCHAFVLAMENRELCPENILPRDFVLAPCLGLAVVDSETSTVRLTHFTLQEYLSRPSLLPDVHEAIAELCLSHLDYDEVRGLTAKDIPNLRNMPFLEYSSSYWGIHAKMRLAHRAEWPTLELLNEVTGHLSVALLLKQIAPYHSCPLPNHLFPSLHAASYFGIAHLVAAAIDVGGCDINQRDCMGRTPLWWASNSGHEGVVRILLAREEVDPDKPDNDGQTPLWGASSNGHEGVVRLLLAREDINPNNPDNYGRTPLRQAAVGGHEGAVRLLLARGDINPSKPDNDGQTPLWSASRNGHEGVVRLLLAPVMVNPDNLENSGQTPFWWASHNGRGGEVRLLRARGAVKPDKPDDYGQTPLGWASLNGHEEVVRLLLVRGEVNPDRQNGCGETPLSQACANSHERVVRLLLARDDVNPNNSDDDGQTPLSCASCNGHEGVVGLLLARSDVNPNKSDSNGQTSLWWASSNGHEGVVRLLLARGDVNPDEPDNDGLTPLQEASKYGRTEIIALLQGREISSSSLGTA